MFKLQEKKFERLKMNAIFTTLFESVLEKCIGNVNDYYWQFKNAVIPRKFSSRKSIQKPDFIDPHTHLQGE